MKSLILAALALNFSAQASELNSSCQTPIEERESYQCRGLFVANNFEDLQRYQINYAKNKRGHVKNLAVNFNISHENLSIATPCKIILKKNLTLSSQNVCLRGENGVIIKEGSHLIGGVFELYSQRRIAIRKNATINLETLRLQSEGQDNFSRAHIRKNSTINATELSLDAHYKSTLGRDSVYNVENIAVNSRGQGRSAVWRNTQINTKKFILNAANEIRFSKNNTLKSEMAIFSANTCKVSDRASLEVDKLSGSCYPIVSHDPTVVITTDTTTGKAPLTVNFDISASFDEDNDIEKFLWDFGDGTTHEGIETNFTHTYVNEGLYTVVVKAIDGLGNIGSDSIEIDVWVKKAPTLVFEHSFLEDGRLLLNLNGSYDEDGRIVSYIYDLGNGDVISNPFLKSLAYGYSEPGTYNVKVSVQDDQGNVTSQNITVTIDEAYN